MEALNKRKQQRESRILFFSEISFGFRKEKGIELGEEGEDNIMMHPSVKTPFFSFKEMVLVQKVA